MRSVEETLALVSIDGGKCPAGIGLDRFGWGALAAAKIVEEFHFHSDRLSEKIIWYGITPSRHQSADQIR